MRKMLAAGLALGAVVLGLGVVRALSAGAAAVPPYHPTRLKNVGDSQQVNVRLGSAIFLHITGAGSTAGCVSLRRADLINVLKWLDPAKAPRIVMAPAADIGRV